MPIQTRTWQRKTIAAARKDGTLDSLRFFIEMDVPPRLRPRPDVRTMPATYPPGWVVTLPVSADDPRKDSRLVVLLAHLKDGNKGRGIAFTPALTAVDVLEGGGFHWYSWGDCPGTVDRVCAHCGAVNHGAADVCAPCPTCRRMERTR